MNPTLPANGSPFCDIIVECGSVPHCVQLTDGVSWRWVIWLSDDTECLGRFTA